MIILSLLQPECNKHTGPTASDSSGYFPGAEATGAGVDVGRFSVDYRLDVLYIGLESTVRASVGMGNLDAETDFLSAKITFCHICTSLS